MDFSPLIKLTNGIYSCMFRVSNFFFRLAFNEQRTRKEVIGGLKQGNKRILVIDTLNIGDLIVTTPIYKTLHSSFPKLSIDLLVKKSTKDIFLGNPHINKIYCYEDGFEGTNLDLRKNKYFIVIDLENYFSTPNRMFLKFRCRSKYRFGFKNKLYTGLFNHLNAAWKLNSENEVINYHNILRPLIPELGVPEKLELYFSDKEKKSAQSLLSKHGLKDGRLVVIHPCFHNPNKWWSVEKFAKLIEKLNKETECRIAITGSKNKTEMDYAKNIEDRTSVKVLNLAGKLAMREWFLVISKADLLIAADTSAIHVAAATNTPTIALFGPSNRIAWRPYNKHNQVIVSAGSCLSCEKDFRFPGCKYGDIRCMKSIRVEQVFAAAKRLIGKKAE